MELLIRVVDRTSPDPYKDVGLTKRGDVIAIAPDGHPWSREERQSTQWRIISCPSLTQAMADSLVSPEPGDRLTNRMLRKRGIRLNVDALDSGRLADLNDPSRAKMITLTRVEAAGLLTVKAPLPDPNIVGP